MKMVKYTLENEIAVLTLNRPEKRNSLHPDLINEFLILLKMIEDEDSAKSLIITGEGTSFCAGADLEYLNSIKEYSAIQNFYDSRLIANLFISLYNCKIPTIAAVNGAAIAGGCGLATACDFIVADKENAKFGYSEAKIGFVPAIVAKLLLNRIGESKTKELLLLGDIIDARKSFEINLVNYLSNNVLQTSLEVSEKLKKNSATSINLTKELIKNISGLPMNDAVEFGININTISRSSEDFSKGINDFLNRSKSKNE